LREDFGSGPTFSFMGYARNRPKRLSEKLLQIREHFGDSQAQLVRRLGLNIPYNNISKFEHGKNEPDLIVLLAYARLINASMEDLVDDQVDLNL
jgi:transcriptional regulator with XRE-family HTH domain